jgi:DtxR family Mn-dependent transcriptional regulator
MAGKAGPKIGQLSESLEDYIEIIYNLIEGQRIARVRDIAKAKNVKMSSVVSALKRLTQEGLVKYEAHEFVELTGPGLDLARRLLRRHQFLTKFLIDVLQIDPKTAERDACQMEHAISLKTMSRIYEFAEFIKEHGKDFDDLLRQFKNGSK